ncbi:hypothetical protein ARMGADRAFT_1087102 [Armillaria gallica]|uniref:Uncharacterized protein n=1 Tax=Armillaria gallica TaxID=47427 RepID=A0A2H3CS20_ARMGA|nr:hypothetical protein ARMGADRAFT_1087102 [Armillaria gallica]
MGDSADDTPPSPASIAPDEFWDNVDLPLSAYFPTSTSPRHCTPTPTGARNLTTWDQPIQNRELTPEPVRVEEPIAGPSTLSVPARCSDWQNTPRRSAYHPPQASAWERLTQRFREQPELEYLV